MPKGSGGGSHEFCAHPDGRHRSAGDGIHLFPRTSRLHPALLAGAGEDDLLLDDKEKTKRDVLDFKRHGGRTIVDATAVDYGRRVEEVKAIAEETGIYVIGTAGFNKSFLWSAKVPERLKGVIGDYETIIGGSTRLPSINWPNS